MTGIVQTSADEINALALFQIGGAQPAIMDVTLMFLI